MVLFQKQNLPMHLLYFIAWFFERCGDKRPPSRCCVGVFGAVDGLRKAGEVCCSGVVPGGVGWSWESRKASGCGAFLLFLGLTKQL